MLSRKKPFSAAQKKKQLQEKRKKKREQQEAEDAEEQKLHQQHAQQRGHRLPPSRRLPHSDNEDDSDDDDDEEENDQDERTPQASPAIRVEGGTEENGAAVGSAGAASSSKPRSPSDNWKPRDVISNVTNGKERLRTIFEAETKEELQQRIAQSQRPFHRLTLEEMQQEYCAQETKTIDMPRRPAWTRSMTPEQLDAQERQYFASYLANVYRKYGRERLNYFEHNLEVWRQLWRVVEMSDVLLLVADIRHPLFHFPHSLYDYCTRYHGKPMMLVLNKCDLVEQEVQQQWLDYFQKRYPKLHVVLFTSFHLDEAEKLRLAKEMGRNTQKKKRQRRVDRLMVHRVWQGLKDMKIRKDTLSSVQMDHYFDHMIEKNDRKGDPKSDAELTEEMETLKKLRETARQKLDNDFDNDEDEFEEEVPEQDATLVERAIQSATDESETDDRSGFYTSTTEPSDTEPDTETDVDAEDSMYQETVSPAMQQRIFKQQEQYLRHPLDETITIGLVGHPNVGKSTVLNALVGKICASTSYTPGHTKHFQTHYIGKHIRICDSPGLVFPAIDMPKQLQVICGLYPIAQLREPYTSVQYLAERVAVEEQLKLTYDTVLQGEEFHGWSAWALCQAYAAKRQFFTPKTARPDVYRAANHILRQALYGNILLRFLPPNELCYLPAVDDNLILHPGGVLSAGDSRKPSRAPSAVTPVATPADALKAAAATKPSSSPSNRQVHFVQQSSKSSSDEEASSDEADNESADDADEEQDEESDLEAPTPSINPFDALEEEAEM